ncbi:MAG: helix-turn-helix transcriptional regulator, partial [Omnitrophica bacterium]|nr:helix-turn-helix transcriptional regulator [Candidatus Omnitrophota bacterium]
INELIMPNLKKLRLKGASEKYVNLLSHNLKALVSPFGRRITDRKIKLTPREIEICNMIKCGLTSKEISNILNISYQTIEQHRKHIRSKLEISNKNVNLTSYLQSL